MSTIGYGYGSEWHLLRYLGFHRKELDRQVAKRIGCTSIRWLDYRFARNDPFLDAELKGMEFLERGSPAAKAYAKFWPAKGNKPNWDAVAQITVKGRQEWLLVEAKSHCKELIKRGGSDADGVGKKTIEAALNETKRYLGVPEPTPWLKSDYYQYANRLATLYFLTSNDEASRLLFIYFCGDAQPKNGNKDCPRSESEWKPSLKAMKESLALPENHPLQSRVHELFLPVCPGGQTGTITKQKLYSTRRPSKRRGALSIAPS